MSLPPPDHDPEFTSPAPKGDNETAWLVAMGIGVMAVLVTLLVCGLCLLAIGEG